MRGRSFGATRLLLSIAVVALAGAGCRSAHPGFLPGGRSQFRFAGPTSPLTVVVEAPQDLRGPFLLMGRHNLAFVPLVPYASSTVYRPEEILEWYVGPGAAYFDPRVHIFDEIVEELGSSKVFADVKPWNPARSAERGAARPTADGVTPVAPAGESGQPPAGDVVLDVKLLQTSATRTKITYCLSGVGFLGFGLLGFPIEHSRERLIVELSLRDARAGGREVWRYRIDERDRFSRGFYYGRPYDLSGDFAALFRRGLGPALESLARYVATAAAPLPERLAPHPDRLPSGERELPAPAPAPSQAPSPPPSPAPREPRPY